MVTSLLPDGTRFRFNESSNKVISFTSDSLVTASFFSPLEHAVRTAISPNIPITSVFIICLFWCLEISFGNRLLQSLGNISQTLGEQSFFQHRQVIGKQNAFDMIVFMLNDPGFITVKFFFLQLPVLVEIRNLNAFFAHHFFPDFRDTETTFGKSPFLA